MMSMTVAFAGNEDNNATNFTKAYMMEVNVNKLGQALNLSRDQYGFMEDAMDVFSADLMCIASAEEDSRQAMMQNALKKNLSATRSILTKTQYHKYLRLYKKTTKPYRETPSGVSLFLYWAEPQRRYSRSGKPKRIWFFSRLIVLCRCAAKVLTLGKFQIKFGFPLA